MAESVSLGIPPGEAAEALSISPDLLRQLSSNRYFADFLEGHRTPQGHRRYSSQDMAMLKYAIQRQKRGINYEATKELLRTKGIAWCLAEELGYEGQTAVLEAQVKHYQALYEAERTKNVELARTEQQYEKARALAAMVLNDAENRKEQAREAVDRAEAQLQEARQEVVQLGSVWSRLFGSMRLVRAEAKLEEAIRSLAEARKRYERVSLGELQAALNLQIAAPSSGKDAGQADPSTEHDEIRLTV